MSSLRVQAGDIKPLGPIWPKLPSEKVRRDGNRSKQEDKQDNRKDRDEGDGKEGRSVDEYV